MFHRRTRRTREPRDMRPTLVTLCDILARIYNSSTPPPNQARTTQQLTLILTRHDVRIHVVLRLSHQLTQGVQTRRRVDRHRRCS